MFDFFFLILLNWCWSQTRRLWGVSIWGLEYLGVGFAVSGFWAQLAIATVFALQSFLFRFPSYLYACIFTPSIHICLHVYMYLMYAYMYACIYALPPCFLGVCV